MRQVIYLVILLIIISACQKKSSVVNDPIYQHMIGKWLSNNSTDEVSVEFMKNGKIKIKNSVERGRDFMVNTIRKYENDKIFNGVEWDGYSFISKNKKGKYKEWYGFYINPTKDTIARYQFNVENSAVKESYIFYTKSN